MTQENKQKKKDAHKSLGCLSTCVFTHTHISIHIGWILGNPRIKQAGAVLQQKNFSCCLFFPLTSLGLTQGSLLVFLDWRGNMVLHVPIARPSSGYLQSICPDSLPQQQIVKRERDKKTICKSLVTPLFFVRKKIWFLKSIFYFCLLLFQKVQSCKWGVEEKKPFLNNEVIILAGTRLQNTAESLFQTRSVVFALLWGPGGWWWGESESLPNIETL